ncbi:NHL repeat-containing protein 2-like isoform X2 [Tubulanus polymorphus]|uniref:NHL repeat-containing protein 2-like isoform X2 n=1 Tax=Tubulanus polymorphus TaxID=672921 RepID=UPI003DA243B3
MAEESESLAIEIFLSKIYELNSEILPEITDETERQKVLREHIESVEHLSVIPQLTSGMKWLNTSRDLNIDDLRGNVVIFDFFTYCCVNCLHILPDLRDLEREYPPEEGVVVVGVHSAKFANEKLTSNIHNAILRFDIKHPVINDSGMLLWQQYCIQCWPTLLIVGPNFQPIFTIVGEGHKKTLFEYTRLVLDYFKSRDQILIKELPIKLESRRLTENNEIQLSFPGDISCSDDGRLLAVSDSGNNRLLIVDRSGFIQHVIGGTDAGFNDGQFDECRFRNPQGTVWKQQSIYVADTDNHSIRLVDLNELSVTTIAGTGLMGNDKTGGNPGLNQTLSSPWDVTIIPELPILLIAMAGTHQIWAYFLEDFTWWKNRSYNRYDCVAVVGNGNEENRNNSYPHRSGFAQPSALVVTGNATDGSVFVADSESSSIRMISLKDGAVKAFVGGDRDPMNLFAFGDVDGKGTVARLQHPLGVTSLHPQNGPIIIADTYNHKIKSVDIKTKYCETLTGSGIAGDQSECSFNDAQFNEPSGICCCRGDETVLFVADTNNHRIQILDLKNQLVSQMTIMFPPVASVDTYDAAPTIQKPLTTDKTILLDCIELTPGGAVDMIFNIVLPDGCYVNEDAPNHWQLLIEDEDQLMNILCKSSPMKGVFNMSAPPIISLSILDSTDDSKYVIKISFVIYFCNRTDFICKISSFILCQPVIVATVRQSAIVKSIVIDHKIDS